MALIAWVYKKDAALLDLLEENIKENLGDLEFDKEFLHTTFKARHMKEEIGKLDFIKIKTSNL